MRRASCCCCIFLDVVLAIAKVSLVSLVVFVIHLAPSFHCETHTYAHTHTFFSLFYIYFYLFLNVWTCKPEWWVHVYMWMNTPVLMCGTSEYVVCWWWLWMCVACVLGQVVGYGWRSSTYTLCTLSIMGFVYHGVVTARWISWSLSREQYSSYCPTTNMTCCINDKGNGHVE